MGIRKTQKKYGDNKYLEKYCYKKITQKRNRYKRNLEKVQNQKILRKIYGHKQT